MEQEKAVNLKLFDQLYLLILIPLTSHMLHHCYIRVYFVSMSGYPMD